MIRVPVLFSRPASRVWYLVLWAPYIALYQLSNRLLVVEPRELPMTALDQAIPFVPELLPLYVAYVPFCLWSLIRSENDEAANRVFYASYFQMALCLPLFVFLPIRFPRELFYGPELYGWADAFWRWFDEPHNCLPSLHAANCLLLITLNWQRSWRWVHTAMAAAIIVSTVLVKQHYVVDLLAGGAVFAATMLFLRRLRIAAPVGGQIDGELGGGPTSSRRTALRPARGDHALRAGEGLRRFRGAVAASEHDERVRVG